MTQVSANDKKLVELMDQAYLEVIPTKTIAIQFLWGYIWGYVLNFKVDTP